MTGLLAASLPVGLGVVVAAATMGIAGPPGPIHMGPPHCIMGGVIICMTVTVEYGFLTEMGKVVGV